MKKVLAGIAAAAMAAVMCVGFAACGNENEAKSIQGYEVTAEQWVAAMEALEKEDAVYTVDVTANTSVKATANLTVSGTKQSGTFKSTATGNYAKNGALEYAKEVFEAKVTGDYEEIMVGELDNFEFNKEHEAYAEYKDGLYTVYEMKDGAWKKLAGNSVIAKYYWSEYKNSYASFEYSADNKGYVLKAPGEDDGLLVIKFDKDANLVAVYMEATQNKEYTVLGEEYKSESTETVNVIIKLGEAKELSLPAVS